MPRKRIGYGRRRQAGGSLWSALKSGLSKVGNWIKDKKIISKGLNLIPHPKAQVASNVADQLGFGRRRRRRKQAGGAKRSGGRKVILFQ